jgi:hypothetical protein
MASISTVVTMYPNNKLFPQLQQCIPTMACHHCCNNVFQQLHWFQLLQQCVPTTTLDYADCPVPRNNVTGWRTDMDASISCSSLMLECGEHFKKKAHMTA